MMIKKQYPFVDIMKSLAIYMVVYYHFNHLQLDFLADNSTVTYFRYFLFSVGAACVPIFFFVNGALLLNKEMDMKKHVMRMVHIIVLTVSWSLITMLLLMMIRNETMGIKEVVTSIWKLKVSWVNHLWFLQTLFVLYTFYPLLKEPFDHNKQVLYFFLSLCFVFTFGNVFLMNLLNMMKFVIGRSDFSHSVNFFHEFNPFRSIYGYSFVYFILGGISMKYYETFLHKMKCSYAIAGILISPSLLSIYGIMVSKGSNSIFDIVWFGYDMLPTILLVLSIFRLACCVQRTSTILSLISKNSLGIYFVHVLWGNLFIKYVSKVPYSETAIVNLLFSAMILMVSLGTVVIIKRIPFLRRLCIL